MNRKQRREIDQEAKRKLRKMTVEQKRKMYEEIVEQQQRNQKTNSLLSELGFWAGAGVLLAIVLDLIT